MDALYHFYCANHLEALLTWKEAKAEALRRGGEKAIRIEFSPMRCGLLSTWNYDPEEDTLVRQSRT